MAYKKYEHEGREYNIESTVDRIDFDNGVETHPTMAAHFAKYAQTAIDLLGYHGMQTIRVSATPMGMGTVMGSGEYIDIYHSPRVFAAIKEELIARRDQWLEIAKGE